MLRLATILFVLAPVLLAVDSSFPSLYAEEEKPAGKTPAAEPEKPSIKIDYEKGEAVLPDGTVFRRYHVSMLPPHILKRRLDHLKIPGLTITVLPKTAAGGAVANIKKDTRFGQTMNSLFLKGPDEAIRNALEVLRVIDRPKRQVVIEAEFVLLVLNENFEVGFSLDHLRSGVKDTFLRGSSIDLNTSGYLETLTTAGAPKPKVFFQGSTFTFYTHGNSLQDEGYYKAIIRVLQAEGKAHVLARPSIIVQEGATARLHAKDVIPTFSEIRTATTTSTAYKDESIGPSFVVTPLRIGDDSVMLKLEPEFSAVEGYVDVAGIEAPQYSTRTAKTVVTIKDGRMLTIGGLMHEQDSHETRKVPILGDLPFIKHLFRSTDTTKSKTDLFLFIRVRIDKSMEKEGTGIYSKPKITIPTKDTDEPDTEKPDEAAPEETKPEGAAPEEKPTETGHAETEKPEPNKPSPVETPSGPAVVEEVE